jgi:hypothetical protein
MQRLSWKSLLFASRRLEWPRRPRCGRFGPDSHAVVHAARKGDVVQSTFSRRSFVTGLGMLCIPLLALAQDKDKKEENDKNREEKKKEAEKKAEDKKDEAKDKAEDRDKVVDPPGTDHSQDRRQDRRRDAVK